MISHQTTIRVRYPDTDQMGVVYHAVFVEYFETGRTEWLREGGMPYASIEKNGVMFPVLEVAVQIKRPAYYDDLVVVNTVIRQMPMARLRIEYEVFRDQTLLATGHTVHAFVDANTMRPVRPPQPFLAMLEKAWKESGKLEVKS